MMKETEKVEQKRKNQKLAILPAKIRPAYLLNVKQERRKLHFAQTRGEQG
jgi:hypothetical protein